MTRTYAFQYLKSTPPLTLVLTLVLFVHTTLIPHYYHTSLGNIIFWLSFCILGQPMAIILYTIDYWKLNVNEPVEICIDRWWRKSCGDGEL